MWEGDDLGILPLISPETGLKANGCVAEGGAEGLLYPVLPNSPLRYQIKTMTRVSV